MLLEGVVEAELAADKAADHRDGRSFTMVGDNSAMAELNSVTFAIWPLPSRPT